ncbi:unnamed protein product [Spirodela intermedia]|uniref:Enoyl reductase (ER) domain-containing protein n=1 Tax=Spirodela intermedia TaxID=51605 RepID=A0A7I8JC78_SPIIN|nr:unnamed protein product [Spirodela intermedia]CAA6667754.1 unnamed protein product [Spirodela intermedia]
MEAVRNKQVLFRGFITAAPKETDMEFRVGTAELRIPEGFKGVLVKNLYLSCDPFLRSRMREFYNSYIPPFTPGSARTIRQSLCSDFLACDRYFCSGVVEGFGISRVVETNDKGFRPGDLVSGLTGWEEYTLITGTDRLRKIQVDEKIPLSHHLGLLGMPGFTAYAGFYEVCSPKKGERVFVSAACGAVGQLVGQLAKLHGCYVVGSAGTKQKVDLLKNKFGFDDAFNYKEEPDLAGAMKRYFPDGIDIYFDNVGGATLDAALLNMRIRGRIAACGMISQHSLSLKEGIHNLYMLIPKRIRMEGFIQSDYLHLFPQFLDRIGDLYKEGRIVYMEDMHQGLESAPATLAGLFSGENVGSRSSVFAENEEAADLFIFLIFFHVGRTCLSWLL